MKRKIAFLLALVLIPLCLSSCAKQTLREEDRETEKLSDPGSTFEDLPEKGSAGDLNALPGTPCYYVCSEPTKDGVEDFLEAAAKSARTNGDRNGALLKEDCYNITPSSFEKAGCGVRIFMHCPENKTAAFADKFFLTENGKLFPLLSGGSYPLVSAAPYDYDGNGIVDVIYTCSWGSGIHYTRVAVFDAASQTSVILTSNSHFAPEYAVFPDPEKWADPICPTAYTVFPVCIDRLRTSFFMMTTPIIFKPSGLPAQSGDIAGALGIVTSARTVPLTRETADSVEYFLCAADCGAFTADSAYETKMLREKELFRECFDDANGLEALPVTENYGNTELGVTFAFYAFETERDLAFAEKTRFLLTENTAPTESFAFRRIVSYEFMKTDRGYYLLMNGIEPYEITKETFDRAVARYNNAA